MQSIQKKMMVLGKKVERNGRLCEKGDERALMRACYEKSRDIERLLIRMLSQPIVGEGAPLPQAFDQDCRFVL